MPDQARCLSLSLSSTSCNWLSGQSLPTSSTNTRSSFLVMVFSVPIHLRLVMRDEGKAAVRLTGHLAVDQPGDTGHLLAGESAGRGSVSPGGLTGGERPTAKAPQWRHWAAKGWAANSREGRRDVSGRPGKAVWGHPKPRQANRPGRADNPGSLPWLWRRRGLSPSTRPRHRPVPERPQRRLGGPWNAPMAPRERIAAAILLDHHVRVRR